MSLPDGVSPHGVLEWYVVYDCGIPAHTDFSLMLSLVSFLLLKNIAEEKKSWLLFFDCVD